jgi:hypothetical protein
MHSVTLAKVATGAIGAHFLGSCWRPVETSIVGARMSAGIPEGFASRKGQFPFRVFMLPGL